MRIEWTERAERGYASIIEYLDTEWGEQAVKGFIAQSRYTFDLLPSFPHLFPTIEDRPELRRGPITRRTILTYRVRYEEGSIQLINIHSTYQDSPAPEDY